MSDHPSKSRQADNDSEKESDYEVGYGRPPLASRFKPGVCGNPKGRPKKSRTLPDAFERELERTITVREGGREKRLTKRDVIARRVADDACRGDARAIRLVRDTIGIGGGKSVQPPGTRASAEIFPTDETDQAILADFAARIREGGILPSDQPFRAPTYPAVDGDNAAVEAPPSPTQH